MSVQELPTWLLFDLWRREGGMGKVKGKLHKARL